MELRPDYPVRARRLALRPLTEADVGALVAYRSLPEVCRWVPFEPMDETLVRQRLRGPWARRHLEAEGQAILLGAELCESGELIGDVLLTWHSAADRGGEVGYVFAPARSGQGYATEAVHQLLHLAFDELGLHRVVARVDTENKASARLCRRLGMRLEAHLVENEWFKGRWADEFDFAILEHEWVVQHETGCPYQGPDREPA